MTKKRIIILIIEVVWLLFGLFGIGYGTYSLVYDSVITKGYQKTEGQLIMVENCDANLVCTGVYKYYLGDTLYTTSTEDLRSKDDFKQYETIYYNPAEPSESVIASFFDDFLWLFDGVIALVSFMIFAFSVKELVK